MKTNGDLMRLTKIVVLVLTVSAFSHAGDNPTYEFLKSDVSPRASAMAGSFVSMYGDPVGIFYNPATIGTAVEPVASFGYTNHLLDINAGYATYSQEYKDVGVMGLGVNYINYGSFDQTDELANKLGTFSAGDMAVSLSVARPFEDNFYYGVTGKFIYSSIAEATSSALAADIGILYIVPGDDQISFGASMTNIGTQLSAYGSTRESLPLEFQIGGTIKPAHLPLELNVDFHKLNEVQDSFVQHFNAFSVGGEFTLSKALRFRFGYNNEQRKELKVGTSAGNAGFSLGGGLVLKKIKIDYSYSSFGLLGSISRIGISLDV
jgi:hypothetical protein